MAKRFPFRTAIAGLTTLALVAPAIAPTHNHILSAPFAYAADAVTLTGGKSEIKLGESATFTATVPNAQEGTVQFYLDGVPVDGPVELTDTTATKEIAPKSYTSGDFKHTVTARYFDKDGYNPNPDGTAEFTTPVDLPQHYYHNGTDEDQYYGGKIGTTKDNLVQSSLDKPLTIEAGSTFWLDAGEKSEGLGKWYENGFNPPAGSTYIEGSMERDGGNSQVTTRGNDTGQIDKIIDGPKYKHPFWGTTVDDHTYPKVNEGYVGQQPTSSYQTSSRSEYKIRAQFKAPQQPGVYVPQYAVYKYSYNHHGLRRMDDAAFLVPAQQLPDAKLRPEETSAPSSTTESTTSETTTPQTTSPAESTTEQSSTEQTTSGEPTPTTTEESTTAESTTEQTTSGEPTPTKTEESTTAETSTEESTTEQPSTEGSTSGEPTPTKTEESTTAETSTEQSSTEQTTSGEPTPTTTEESTTAETSTEESTTAETTTEQSSTEQTTSQQQPPAQEATAPTVTVTAPTGEQTTADDITLTATIDPASEGTVEFFNGETSLGTVNVTDGTATFTTKLAEGDYSVTAKFTPAEGNTTAKAAESTPAAKFTVNKKEEQQPPAQEATAPTVTVTAPAGKTTADNITLTATVDPASEGTVEFFNGETSLGTVNVTDGTATFTTKLAEGTNKIVAKFTPAQDNTTAKEATSQITEVNVTKKTDTPAPTSDYTPEVKQETRKTTEGATLPAPGDVLANTQDLPAGAVLVWTKLPTQADPYGEITISSPNGATTTATVAFEVVEKTTETDNSSASSEGSSLSRPATIGIIVSAVAVLLGLLGFGLANNQQFKDFVYNQFGIRL